MIRRLVAGCLAAACVSGMFAVAEAASPSGSTCVDAAVGDGWYNVAQAFAPPTWWVTATRAQRDAFTQYVIVADGGKDLTTPLYAGRHVCINPARIPAAPTTTTTGVSTSVPPTSTTTTTSPSTTTTVRPTTTTTSSPPPSSTTSTTSPGACTGAPGTPGSPDGQGGCFPSAASTGPNAAQSTMGDYTGPCTITTSTTITSKVIRCELQVNSGTLTISNSYVLSTGININGGALMLVDSYMNGGRCVDCNVYGPNWTILRTEIDGGNRGAYCTSHCTIQDSWVHGTNLDQNGAAHASAVRVEQFTTVVHNTLACDWPTPNDQTTLGCSADLTGYGDFASIHDNTITNNLLRANNPGQAFCAYGGATAGKPHSGDAGAGTNIVWRNNVFERGPNGKCGTYGPVTDFASSRAGNVWTNNRWSDGGTVAPA